MKDKEARALLREFVKRFPSSESMLGSPRVFEEVAVSEGSVFFFDGKPMILRTGAGVLPSLKFDELIQLLPKVVVDMGAVPHVANGAQIMRPGIKEVKSNFGKNDLVVIVDEKFGKTLALGMADFNSEEMRSLGKGKVITNLHYVGDEFWKSFTQ